MSMPHYLEKVSCPLGCPTNDETVLSGQDLLHGRPGEFTVVTCRRCGLMRTNPRPPRAVMTCYYPDDYGPYRGTRVPQGNPAIGKTGLISAAKKRGKALAKKLVTFDFQTATMPRVAPGKLLEVGCASGGFLHHMAALGWEVEGIEFSPHAAQAAAELGYRVHVGPLESAPAPLSPVDLIVGWMVLEHLHDPIVGLRKLHQWATPGTWLVLSVPNAASLEFKIFRKKWYALQVPTHLYHFTPETLERVLQAGGWKMEKVYHQRIVSNLIASTGYVLRDKGFVRLGQKLVNFPERAGKWPYVLYPLAWLLSLFGQTGRMTVWARQESQGC